MVVWQGQALTRSRKLVWRWERMANMSNYVYDINPGLDPTR